MAMTTRCPHCGTAFKVVADQLRVRNGLVRCGVCSRVFDGFAAVIEGPVRPAPAPASPPPPAMPSGPVPASVPPTIPRSASFPPSAGDPAPGMAAAPVLSVQAAPESPAVFQGRTPAIHRPETARTDPGPAPAVLRGREDSRRFAADPADAAFSSRSRSPGGPDDEDDDAGDYREPYAPYRQDDLDDAEQQARDMALPRDERFSIYPHRDVIEEEDEPIYVSVPGEARTRYDDLTDAGMAPPIFMDEEVQRRRTLVARLWAAGCVLGLLALGLQCIYIYRTSIATAVPALRPAFESVCAQLGCQVGYTRRLERISITASTLQPQSGAAASDDNRMRLVLTVTMRNRYDKPQPWPALMLQLTDLSDTVVVRKVLLPENYLPPGTQGPFPAGGEQSLSVPVLVDGLHVNGYQLDKFFP